MQIPLLDLSRQYETIKEEINHAVLEVLAGGRYILGENVKLFEQEVAAYIGVPYAVGVASGSDALYLALLALGIGPGDEVIVPAFTFFATAGSVARTGATPVFADIKTDTFNIDPADLEKRITDRTKAIIPVHLYGQAADMDEIMAIAGERGIKVVEDAAQAFGATYKGRRVGALGDMACFSFFPSKNLGGAGDGGMVVTADADLAEAVRVLRVHGSRPKYYHHRLGINSRLDEIQAAILRVKLRHLEKWNVARRQVAGLYQEALAASGEKAGLTLPGEDTDRLHIYHQYTVRVPERDRIQGRLKEKGISTAIYYPLPLHLQPVFKYLGYEPGSLPVAERACREVLSLPMDPGLTAEQVETVAGALLAALHEINGRG